VPLDAHAPWLQLSFLAAKPRAFDFPGFRLRSKVIALPSWRNGRYCLARPIHEAAGAVAGRLDGSTLHAVGGLARETARAFDFSGFCLLGRLLILLASRNGRYCLARATLGVPGLRGRGVICLRGHLAGSNVHPVGLAVYLSICLSFYRSIGL
jgi:hypothetical protein